MVEFYYVKRRVLTWRDLAIVFLGLWVIFPTYCLWIPVRACQYVTEKSAEACITDALVWTGAYERIEK